MAKWIAGPEIIAGLRKARAEGKVLPAPALELLREEDEREKTRGGKKKLAVALYLLGGSLNQVATKLEIKKGTVWTYVRELVPEAVRKAAAVRRDFGRSGPLVERIALDEYVKIFSENSTELVHFDPIVIAGKLEAIVKAVAPAPESLDDPTDEPY